MQVTPSTFTIAEYCNQMDAGTITVNKDYRARRKFGLLPRDPS